MILSYAVCTNALSAIKICGVWIIHKSSKSVVYYKQESIPKETRVVRAKIINFLRQVSLKKNEEASFASCYQIRNLRNVMTKFAGEKTRFSASKMFPTRDKKDFSIFIDPKTLYLLFCKDHNIYQKQNKPFNSLHEINTDTMKESLVKNFFDWKFIQRILTEQKLIPIHTFSYSNQYSIHFLGRKRPTKGGSEGSGAEVEFTADADNASPINREDLQRKVIEINREVKELKKKYSSLTRELKKTETERADAGRASRESELKDGRLHPDMYNVLKTKSNERNALYRQLRELNDKTKDGRTNMYYLNKDIKGQKPTVDRSRVHLTKDMSKHLGKGSLLIQGVDPGIVTTASVFCGTAGTFLNAINRYQALIDHEECDRYIGSDKSYSCELTANIVNEGVLSNYHRAKREKATKKNTQISKKMLQRDRVTREIRNKKFYQKYCSQTRNKAFDYLYKKKGGGSMVSFIGNWSRAGKFIRGHSRRSLKPFMKQLKSVEKDGMYVVDEYRSTVTCFSCFQPTTKQLVRESDGTSKRVKVAVVCTNDLCPKRIVYRKTTTNRDQNGAKNIALIGLSMALSDDGLTLPLFRRGQKYNAHKYNLSSSYDRTSLVTSVPPGVQENQ